MNEQDEDTLAASIAEETRGRAEPEPDEAESEQEDGNEEEQLETEEESEDDAPEEEEESEEEAEEGQEEEEEPPQGRGARRIRRLQAESARLREENAALRRGDGTEKPVRPAMPDPQAMQKRLRDELAKDLDQFEFKTPEQRADILLRAQQKAFEPFMRGIAGAVGADRDRSAFREAYQNKPFYKQLVDKVEKQFNDAQAQGYFIPREQFFKQAVADLALSGAGQAQGKQKHAANVRKQKARGVSTTARGDTSARGGRLSSVKEFERKYGDRKI